MILSHLFFLYLSHSTLKGYTCSQKILKYSSWLSLLVETIHLTIDLLFEAKSDLKISRKDLQKLFQFATNQTNFLFNGNMYDQGDGVAIGSPLAPTLANIFMVYHEKWLG